MTTTERGEEIKKFISTFNESLGLSKERTGRALEIEKFRDEFNDKLKQAYVTFNENVKIKKNNLQAKKKLEIEKKRSLSQSDPDTLITTKPKKKKVEIENPLNQKPNHWIPNYFHARYFEKYKKLHEEHEMNNWEIVK